MESNVLKRIYRKTQSIIGIKPNGGVIIKTAKWIKGQSDIYLDATKKKSDISVRCNMDKRISYPNLSRSIECAIEDICKRQENHFKNMLVIKNPYQYSPLCALAIFSLEKPYSVRVTVRGKSSDCDISYVTPERTNQRVPIMGLYPDYENVIDIELVNKNGKSIRKKTFKMYVAPLKGKSSTIKVTKEISETEYLYGLTLVYGGDDGIYPYAFDRNGDIRFAFAMSPKTYGFQPISKGRFLFLNKSVTRLTFTNPTSTQMFEVDQMGKFHTIYNIEKGVHHDFVELKDGNLVMGSNSIEGKTYEDTIIELDRKTGAIVNEIFLKDYIDDKYVDGSDWAHLNSIEYNKLEKTVMVCLRNLHSVIKLNYKTRQIEWIFGNPIFWKNSKVEDKVLAPKGDNMKWFFQAHAAYFINADLDKNPDTKHLIIYDNHVQKRIPVSFYDDDDNSYVRIYEINERQNTVKLYKSFLCERSKIRSNGIFEKDAERIFAMNGKLERIFAMSGKLKKITDNRKGSITEFDFETNKILNQFAVNYGFYRAYGFDFEPQYMSEKMDLMTEYSLGRVYDVNLREKINIDTAKKVPKPILDIEDKTEADRKARLNKLVTKNPDYYVDPQQDIARIRAVVEEDTLYVTLLDHQLEKIYLAGGSYTYCRDFTDTKQERPEYFARAINTDAIPLKDLEEDNYDIYYKHNTGLYKSGYKITVKKHN